MKIENVHSPRFEGEGAGRVQVEPASKSPDPLGLRMNRVTFPGKVKTIPHCHKGGQLIYVVSGTCRIEFEDREDVVLTPGQGYWTEPGVRHQHGADGHFEMVHMVATLGETIWGENPEDQKCLPG